LTVQALSSTEVGYDLLAPKFDRTPFRTPDAILRAVVESLRTGPNPDRGLDLCCGTGAGMETLRELGCGHVVGLDFSRGMLSVARRRLAAVSGSARLDHVRGNALALPFGPVFEIVVCFGAFGHILEHDQLRFVAEVARVLRPGGRFVFLTSHMPPLSSARYWLGRGFNAVMHLRNLLLSPPFVMYYLTFLLPDVQRLLEQVGLEVQIRRLDQLAGPWADLRLVTATRRGPGCAAFARGR
jgi:ubiquinone/menaquinone biosynthesis C-methylase UbiE